MKDQIEKLWNDREQLNINNVKAEDKELINHAINELDAGW